MTTDPIPKADLPIRPAGSNNTFDIVATYDQLHADNPDLTKTVLAIKALMALLESVPSSTTHETIEMLTDASNRLRSSVPNPVPILAGTQLFLASMRQVLKEQDGNFDAVRSHLIQTAQVVAQRSIDSRKRVAEFGSRKIWKGDTILTHGKSRVVMALIELAQKKIPGGFNVIYVRDEEYPEESAEVVSHLRSLGIPTSPIREGSVHYALRTHAPRVNAVFLGAEVFTQDGGFISRMGACQIARLASECNIKTYACGEEHKFCVYQPADEKDVGRRLGYVQEPLHCFSTDGKGNGGAHLIEWTPAKFISEVICDTGSHLPTYVCQTLINHYGSFSF